LTPALPHSSPGFIQAPIIPAKRIDSQSGLGRTGAGYTHVRLSVLRYGAGS